jgi:hypothetical protein
MAKGRRAAALGALLGAGALATKQIPYLGRVDLNQTPKNTQDADLSELESAERDANSYRKVTPSALKAARKRTFETEPSLRGTLMSGEGYPVLSGTGLPIKYGLKKGGKVTASRRADGIAKRGKTKGRML